MTLETEVQALRDSVQTAYEATRFVVTKSVIVGPDRRARMLKTMEDTLVKAERVFDAILFDRDANKFQMAVAAVEMTLMAWQELQSNCLADVGLA